MSHTSPQIPEQPPHDLLEQHDQHAGPIISSGWKMWAVLGNGIIGGCEIALGGVSSLAVTADGLHNAGDTATYWMQANNVQKPELPQKRLNRSRKLAHWIIAASSIAVSTKAGIDLSLGSESVADPMAMYTAGASLALNGILLARFQKGIRNRKRSRGDAHTSVYERDLLKHFWAVDMPSAGLALAGAVLQKYNMPLEQTAALASGFLGAYVFRPTKSNMSQHSCLTHDHGAVAEGLHTDHNHEEHRVHSTGHQSKKSWVKQHIAGVPEQAKFVPRRKKLLAGLGMTALACIGALAPAHIHDKHDAQTTLDMPSSNAPFYPGMQDKLSMRPAPITVSPKPKFIPTAECVTIKPNDSEWSIAKQRIIEATGNTPNVATVNVTTLFMADLNKGTFPRPGAITVGECMFVPTFKSARILDGAITNLGQTEPQFAKDIALLNSKTTIADALRESGALTRIEDYLFASASKKM